MIEIIDFKRMNKGNLLGFLTIKIAKWGNFIIKDITVFNKNGNRWISFPSRIVEDQGEKKYFPYVRFEAAEVQKSFQEKVLTSLDSWMLKNPEQLEAPPASEQCELPF